MVQRRPATASILSNDGTLEMFYTATRTTQFVISGDSTQYSLGANNLPQATGAIRSDVARTDTHYEPYRAVIGVRSLRCCRGASLQRVIPTELSASLAPLPLLAPSAAGVT